MRAREIDKHWRWLKQHFLDKRDGAMQAEDKSPSDKHFDALTAAGLVECYDCQFGFNYYTFTKAGRKRWLSA